MTSHLLYAQAKRIQNIIDELEVRGEELPRWKVVESMKCLDECVTILRDDRRKATRRRM